MIILWVLYLSSCQNSMLNSRIKGKLDEVVQEPQNYLSKNVLELEQGKVIKIMEAFLSKPEDLEYPLAPSPYERFSFLHLLFSIKSNGYDKPSDIFKSVYNNLLDRYEELTEDSIFESQTELDHNIIHLSLKYANRSGFEKIKEINKKRDLRKHFVFPDILGRDSLIFASSTLASGLMDSSYYDVESLLSLKEAISYMISKKYFLNSEGSLTKSEDNRTFLMESINAFADFYDDENEDSVNHIKEFMVTFKFLLASLLFNTENKIEIIKELKLWESVTEPEVPEILRDKMNKFINSELDLFIEKYVPLSKIDKYYDKKCLSLAEKAMKSEDTVALSLLMNLGCRYPYSLYQKIVDTKSAEMFNLIPHIGINFQVLARIKDNQDKVLEKEFLDRIKATEFQKLVVERRNKEAISRGREWVMKNYNDKDGVSDKRISMTEILCACNEELLKYIIEDKEENRDKEAIILAAENGHERVCDLLIRMGAKIDLADKDEKTALMLAAQNGHREVCYLLIKRVAKKDLADKDGKTAMMLAAENGRYAVCDLLIGIGAKIDLADKDGKTAMMLAAENDHERVGDLLIRGKARRSLADKDGKTVKNTNKKTALSYQCNPAFLSPESPSHVSSVREIHSTERLAELDEAAEVHCKARGVYSTGGLAEMSKEKDATVEKRE